MPLDSTVPLPSLPLDPELTEIVHRTLDEVADPSQLSTAQRLLVRLSATAAAGAVRQFELLLNGAAVAGITPQELKEVVYQAVPYAGLGRAVSALETLNRHLQAQGLATVYEGFDGSDPMDRAEEGLALQKLVIGGEAVDRMYAESPMDLIHIQRLLSANCFGDYVARGAIDVATRELLTVAMLAALGGCEPQLRGHVAANARVGNGRAVLIDVLTLLIPFIGYPRTLNAIRVVNEVLPAAVVG